MAIQQPIKPKSRPFTLNFGPQHLVKSAFYLFLQRKKNSAYCWKTS